MHFLEEAALASGMKTDVLELLMQASSKYVAKNLALH
jgi:hypothetical protein